MTQIADKGAVFITGSSTGIGKACALRLCAIGFQVYAGVRNQHDADVLRSEAAGIAPILVDITDGASIVSAAHAIESAVDHDGLWGLVNNAGIVVGGPLEFLPIAELRRQLEVNIVGHVAVTQAFAPMLRKRRGRIINIGSDLGRITIPFLGGYCASKYALEAISAALRMELRPQGIHVSIVEPGNISTPLWGKSLKQAEQLMNGLPEEAHHSYAEALERVRAAVLKTVKTSAPAASVAKVVTHALTTRWPKARYIIGCDAKIRILLSKWLPSYVMDRIIMRCLGL